MRLKLLYGTIVGFSEVDKEQKMSSLLFNPKSGITVQFTYDYFGGTTLNCG